MHGKALSGVSKREEPLDCGCSVHASSAAPESRTLPIPERRTPVVCSASSDSSSSSYLFPFWGSLFIRVNHNSGSIAITSGA